MASPSALKRTSDKRERILDAARAVFLEKGYEQASVSEIVKRAGVAQGTFYLYFKAKADLPHAFAEELRQVLFEHTRNLLSDEERVKDLKGTLETMLQTVYQTVKSSGTLFDIIASETRLSPMMISAQKVFILS